MATVELLRLRPLLLGGEQFRMPGHVDDIGVPRNGPMALGHFGIAVMEDRRLPAQHREVGVRRAVQIAFLIEDVDGIEAGQGNGSFTVGRSAAPRDRTRDLLRASMFAHSKA